MSQIREGVADVRLVVNCARGASARRRDLSPTGRNDALRQMVSPSRFATDSTVSCGNALSGELAMLLVTMTWR